MTILTADLCDEFGEEIRVASPVFRSYGGRASFGGPVRTVRVFEDNSLVKAALQTDGAGAVLVVDGGGSTRVALLGGDLAVLAERNGWAGLVMNACIRDVLEVDAVAIGVRALGTCPRKSVKRGLGENDVPVSFADVEIDPGDYVYADEDGVIIARRELTTAAG